MPLILCHAPVSYTHLLDKYNAAEQGSEEYYLWETMTLRTRNMVFDALDVPIKAMEIAKAALYD